MGIGRFCLCLVQEVGVITARLSSMSKKGSVLEVATLTQSILLTIHIIWEGATRTLLKMGNTVKLYGEKIGIKIGSYEVY